MATRRAMLTVQYDGTDYGGMQSQPNAPTIQDELQRALAVVLGHDVKLTFASRTDAGVHAMGQVVTFETDRPIPLPNLKRAANDHLPLAVNILDVAEVSLQFHPRFDARGKLYSYRILNREAGSPFIARYAWHLPEPLDVEALQEATQWLIGEHDFAAFCAAGSNVKQTVRTLYRLDCQREGDIIELHFEGDGFLYMMVRIMVGTLVEVAAGRLEPYDVAAILASRDRDQAGPTAPPQGLCLLRIDY